jgi:hypothetical protein
LTATGCGAELSQNKERTLSSVVGSGVAGGEATCTIPFSNSGNCAAKNPLASASTEPLLAGGLPEGTPVPIASINDGIVEYSAATGEARESTLYGRQIVDQIAKLRFQRVNRRACGKELPLSCRSGKRMARRSRPSVSLIGPWLLLLRYLSP